jgi:hypothetical protein
MIPPFLITQAKAIVGPLLAKASSPLVKWGIIVAVLIFTNLWTWHRTTLECEREKVEAIAEQAAEFSKQQASVIASREDVLRQRNDTEREANQKIVDLQKRLVTYERNAKKSNVPVPPDSVGMFNAISSLLPAQDAVSGADPASGKPHESPEARIEVTRLLLAYVRAYADCGGELKSLWDDYDALVNTLRLEYAIETGAQ